MQLDDQDNAHPDPVNETGTLIEVSVRASQAGSPCLGWMSLYSRLAGCIQWLYALVFGWYAIDLLSHCYHPEFRSKDIHDPAYLSLVEVFFGTICTLLSLSGFIGGYGLLGLQRWVRRWEIANLGVLSVGVTAVTVGMSLDVRSGPADFTALVLFSLAFALPYVPFLFGVVGGGTGATLLGAPGKKKPVSVSGGVRDRALDC
jgi:hypothetical protein